MKSKHFASICTGTSNAFRRRAGTRSVGIPQGSACADLFILETHAFLSQTPSAQVLPQMNGSGMVRNLRAAMSLSGTPADELEAALTAFAAATTRDAQRA